MATLDQLIAKEIVIARLDGRSFYFEMTCQGESDPDGLWPACGQRFKVVRGSGCNPLCPRCKRMQDCRGTEGLLEAICGIPVD